MTVSENLLNPEAVTSEGFVRACELREAQGHAAEDLDLWLDGDKEGTERKGSQKNLVDVQQTIKLGLRSLQDEPPRSASGASVNINNKSQMSNAPASQRPDREFNLMKALKTRTDAAIKAQPEARVAEAKAAELEKEQVEHAKQL